MDAGTGSYMRYFFAGFVDCSTAPQSSTSQGVQSMHLPQHELESRELLL